MSRRPSNPETDFTLHRNLLQVPNPSIFLIKLARRSNIISAYCRTKRTKAGSESSNCFKSLFGLLSFTYSAQKQTDQELYLQSLSRTSAPPPTPPALRIALTLEWPSSDWHGHRPGPRRLNQQGTVSTSSISCGDLSFLYYFPTFLQCRAGKSMSLEWEWLRLVKGYSSALKFSQNMNISYITNFEVLLNLLLRMLPSLFVRKIFLIWSNINLEVFEKRHRCAVINFLFFHLDETSWIKPKLVETWCLSKRQSCCSCMHV